MSENKLTHVTGTFLIQAEGSFLNGGGLESGEYRNATAPKTFWDVDKQGRRIRVPYVSAQAWRHWLRETFKEEYPNHPHAELKALSYNAKGNPNKIGTDMNPIHFAEDDIFGYMRAAEGQGTSKAKTKAVMRSSPFSSSILRSIRKDSTISTDEGYVHLNEGSPVPYTTVFYNTQLQGLFGLNCSRLGVFRNDGDRIELDEELVEKYIEDGVIHNKEGEENIYEVTDNKSSERATMILKSLAVLRGGAKQAQFGTDISPKAIIIAGLNCGNLIFSNIFDEKESQPIIKIDTLQQVYSDYQNRLSTPIYIGIRKGYMHSENELELEAVSKNSNGSIVLTSPIEAIDKLTSQLS